MTGLYWTGAVIYILASVINLLVLMAKKDPTGSDVATGFISLLINAFLTFLLIHAAVNS